MHECHKHLYYSSFFVSHHLIFCVSPQFSCLAAGPSVAAPAADGVQEVNTPRAGLVHWAPGGPAGPDPALGPLPAPRHRPGPVLTLRLFVTEDYEQKRIGPCVVTAGHRVYVEVGTR